MDLKATSGLMERNVSLTIPKFVSGSLKQAMIRNMAVKKGRNVNGFILTYVMQLTHVTKSALRKGVLIYMYEGLNV